MRISAATSDPETNTVFMLGVGSGLYPPVVAYKINALTGAMITS